MPIVSTTKMTARQFLELGQDPPGVRLELVNGEVAVSPSPTPKHSHVVVRLISNDEYNVRRPDVLFFAKSRTHLIGEKAMEGPPDLAVEVLSPCSIEVDREDKFAQYCDAGVAHYWIVDPAHRTIEGWRLEGGQYVPTGRGQETDVVRLLPFVDLDVSLARLWRAA